MTLSAAIFALSGSLGYLLPAIIGLESLGVPSPGETALLLSATLASQGKLQIWLVIVIASASAIAGDSVAYGLGRWLGRDVLEAPGPFQNYRIRIIRVGDRFFEKHGSRTVFLGRWVTVVRSVVAWLAGINEMPYLHFFFWNALGGITWATAYGLAGYFGGDAAVNVFKTVGLGAAIAIGVALVIAYGVYHVRKRRREQDGQTADGARTTNGAQATNGAQTPHEASADSSGPDGPESEVSHDPAEPETSVRDD